MPLSKLTKREREVTELAARGQTYRQIAAQLSISPGTAKIHLNNIYMKLEINSRIGLMHLWMRAQPHNLLQSEQPAHELQKV